ncbi:MAG: SprT family zinc-dependent metalloprotease [Pseudotabrizicola sp.]|uniref:M48 family metallopeptidase n=1 Tax=Pseudotabrizicola sp. TaxID=2939647 RepID=UPI00271F0505|nr:SprT family zinc-dependent metalloprotease [Pseudotabrizicola sp.]MDO8882797.1 SprT family zinc-dependent metalloprotease [Pseudotabrizicola sp.]MDP2080080.1 SprT family zinc-dependent metalloprotease [Pseudotabrizicola sp.]MDZ7575526.1 SprT family zinc-dependent metalloprotease [Pseudotabrizicola sp.]
MPHLPGSPPVEITLRRSARAKRFSLRVSRLDGRVTLSMPLRAREAEALRFATEQEGWIRGVLAEMPGRRVVGLGDAVPVEGQMRVLTQGTGRSVRLEGDSLLVPGDPQQAGVRAGAFLKLMARDRLAAACDRHAGRLGRPYTRLTLRDTRSRWGSCAHDGALMFSWRLIMAPAPVLDYVAAHEVAHLEQMNHSPAFWSVVEQLFPRWQVQRRWLHGEGQALHGYLFGPQSDATD